jgi:hypothetical protein
VKLKKGDKRQLELPLPVRQLESIAETQPNFKLALLRLSAMIDFA